MSDTQVLAILIIIFILAMAILTVVAIRYDKIERIGILHVTTINGNIAWYAELYDGKSPEDLCKFENVSLKIKVDKEIGEDGES